MSRMPGGPSERGSQRRTLGSSPDAHQVVLARGIREALESYLKGRRLVRMQVRRVEGDDIEGFLKVVGDKGENLLVDFRATSTPQGGLLSLEVGGMKIVVDAATSRRAHRPR
jgi:hypothetical protein